MESLLYRLGSESHIFWRYRSEKAQAGGGSHSKQNRHPALQRSGGNWNRRQALYGPTLHDCYRAFPSRSTGLLPRRHRDPAIIGRAPRVEPSLGSSPIFVQRFSSGCFSLTRKTACWMRIGPRQAGIEFALLSRPGAARRAPNKNGPFLLSSHTPHHAGLREKWMVNCDQPLPQNTLQSRSSGADLRRDHYAPFLPAYIMSPT